MLAKVLTLIRTLFSGRCTRDEYILRNQSCNTCDALKINGGNRYCGACDCPNWRLAELDTKLRYKKLICPQNKSGFYRG